MTKESKSPKIESKGRVYCFPTHGISVRAESTAEANEKLEEILAKKTKKADQKDD